MLKLLLLGKGFRMYEGRFTTIDVSMKMIKDSRHAKETIAKARNVALT